MQVNSNRTNMYHQRTNNPSFQGLEIKLKYKSMDKYVDDIQEIIPQLKELSKDVFLRIKGNRNAITCTVTGKSSLKSFIDRIRKAQSIATTVDVSPEAVLKTAKNAINKYNSRVN